MAVGISNHIWTVEEIVRLWANINNIKTMLFVIKELKILVSAQT